MCSIFNQVTTGPEGNTGSTGSQWSTRPDDPIRSTGSTGRQYKLEQPGEPAQMETLEQSVLTQDQLGQHKTPEKLDPSGRQDQMDHTVLLFIRVSQITSIYLHFSNYRHLFRAMVP